jgi:endonuclease YncB( thermonuclease family)
MPGLLRIRGAIELQQFWPDGEADADTAKIQVNVNANSFTYAADGEHFRQTNVFRAAWTVGKSKRAVIDDQSRITVRLQGIDAPELHYKAGPLSRTRAEVTPEKREKFNALNRVQRRQYWAETATVALAQKLAGFNATRVQCVVDSFVDHPYEAVDTYGRVVGNIRVGASFETDINVWLVEQGYAFPTFYSSMTEDEINTFLTALKIGRKKKRVWAYLSGDTRNFDADLVYRKGGPVDEQADKGPVLMPKLFRRQLAFEMEKAAKLAKGSFKSYLERSPDACFELADFLRSGVHVATPRRLNEFFKQGVFELEPHEVVFKEKFSSVVDATGKRIDKF